MKDELASLADQLALASERVGDLVFAALRAQNNAETAGAAKALERDLAKVRRSLVKAEHLLRGLTPLD